MYIVTINSYMHLHTFSSYPPPPLHTRTGLSRRAAHWSRGLLSARYSCTESVTPPSCLPPPPQTHPVPLWLQGSHTLPPVSCAVGDGTRLSLSGDFYSWPIDSKRLETICCHLERVYATAWFQICSTVAPILAITVGMLPGGGCSPYKTTALWLPKEPRSCKPTSESCIGTKMPHLISTHLTYALFRRLSKMLLHRTCSVLVSVSVERGLIWIVICHRLGSTYRQVWMAQVGLCMEEMSITVEHGWINWENPHGQATRVCPPLQGGWS